MSKKRAKRKKRWSHGLQKPLGKKVKTRKCRGCKCKCQCSNPPVPWYNTLLGVVILGIMVNNLSVFPGKIIESVFQGEIEFLTDVTKVIVLGTKLTIPTLTGTDLFLLKNRAHCEWTRFKHYLEQRG